MAMGVRHVGPGFVRLFARSGFSRERHSFPAILVARSDLRLVPQRSHYFRIYAVIPVLSAAGCLC